MSICNNVRITKKLWFWSKDRETDGTELNLEIDPNIYAYLIYDKG